MPRDVSLSDSEGNFFQFRPTVKSKVLIFQLRQTGKKQRSDVQLSEGLAPLCMMGPNEGLLWSPQYDSAVPSVVLSRYRETLVSRIAIRLIGVCYWIIITSDTYANRFMFFLSNLNLIRLYLLFSDWFGAKLNSIWPPYTREKCNYNHILFLSNSNSL